MRSGGTKTRHKIFEALAILAKILAVDDVGGIRNQQNQERPATTKTAKPTKENQTMNATQTSAETTTTQPVKVLYTARTHTTGGREGGASRTSDGRLDVKFTHLGTAGNGTNPEQLLAAGWSSCFLSAVKIVAHQMKVRLQTEPVIDAEIDLCSGDDGYSLRARLNVSMPGVDREVGQSILTGAEQTCPYSKATKGNIEVEVNLV